MEHVDALEIKGLSTAGSESAAGAVTIMSIHKSKGLEFPVVFVCGLSKSFNKENTRGQVLCDQDLGVGLGAVEEQDRVRYPTIAKRAVSAKIEANGLSEEMRVLYVALTRARDRLIMTYASSCLEKDLTELVAKMDMSDQELLTLDAGCSGEWVLMTALRRTEAGELFGLGGYPENRTPGQPAWHIRVTQAPETQVAMGVSLKKEKTKLPKDALHQVRQGLSFNYAHTAATQAPSKQTATQRKGRYKDEEIAELTRYADERINAAKERLAYEVTKIVHTEEDAQKAQAAAKAAFGGGNGEDMIAMELSFEQASARVTELLVTAGITKSIGEGRRLIEGGAVSLDDVKITDVNMTVPEEIINKGEFILHKGKKIHQKIAVK